MLLFKEFLFLVTAVLLVGLAPYEGNCQRCCPSFWTEFDCNCYRLYKQREQWEAAEKLCTESDPNEKKTPHLTSINSAEEQTFVHDLVKNSGINYNIYIGLYDLQHNRDFVWSNGDRWEYTNWKGNEPNNLGGSEWYTHMYHTNGLWNDEHVKNGQGSAFGFVCKMPNN